MKFWSTTLPLSRAKGLALGATLLGGLSACTGTIAGDRFDEQPEVGPGPGDTVGGGGVIAGSGGTAVPTAAACRDPALPTEAPLRRLTEREYRNTVRDLFPGVGLPEFQLGEVVSHHSFDNEASGQAVAALIIERYDAAAEAIARAAMTMLSAWAPCRPLNDAAGCARRIMAELGPRVYRRPLASDEQTRLGDFAAEAVTAFGFDGGVALALRGLLQSPHFLYRLEPGVAGAEGAVVPLDGFELATRLSYLLWQTMPDAALFDAARSGRLGEVEGLRAEAERLLDDPRARAVLRDLGRQWTGIDRLNVVDLDRAAFPELAGAREDLKTSALAFVEEELASGDVRSLLLTSRAYLNRNLAGLYGAPEPSGAGWDWVPLDPGQRAGLLTQAGLLASTSHGLGHAPILRGTFVLERILCMPLPAPPPDVNAAIPEPAPGELRTTRQHIEETHGSGACVGCHSIIDPVGFAFEHFDALGRYRTSERGLPVNASGTLALDDGDLRFDGAVALSRALAERPEVAECAGRQLFRFALGRREVDADACRIAHLGERAASEGGFRQALLSLVESPSFRMRPAVR